ncbi:30S ribosomal protein S9 [Patescibacteria group bacterium]|nr:30S ribosomal protein S9 [Patescibacteria group bacterium]
MTTKQITTEEEKTPVAKKSPKKPVDSKKKVSSAKKVSDEETEKSDKDKKIASQKDYNPFEGKFISATGKRKTATARVRLYENGKGIFKVNDERLNNFFDPSLTIVLTQPLKLTTHLKDINLSIITKGGGKKGQSLAVRHGIVKALIALDPELRPKLKAKGWLMRDPRKKERKKPGLKKARKAPQWSKR